MEISVRYSEYVPEKVLGIRVTIGIKRGLPCATAF